MLWFATSLGVIEALFFFMVGCFLFKNRKHSSVDNHEYVLAVEQKFRKFSYWEWKHATKGFTEKTGKDAEGTEVP